MTSNEYHYVTHWHIPGTIEEVADILRQATELVRWWPSVYLDVQEGEAGDEQGIGRVIHLYTKGWLPYTLRWSFRVTESNYPDGFALEAWGDFVGRGIWTFKQNGEWADVTYEWKIRADKPLLKYLSFLMKPIFGANHQWAMRMGEESLKLELMRRHANTTEERASIPPPPGPTFKMFVERARRVNIQPPTQLPCDPVIENIRFDGEPDPKTSERLQALFDEDQRYASEPADWTDPELLLNQLGQDMLKQREDEARAHRVEVLELLQQGKITLAADLYHAAMIYQHGACADHFKLANKLAERSMVLGYGPALWLYAASRDRYLVAMGRPQQFGTQLHWDKIRGWSMPALDARTTDEDRAKYDVPPMAELWARLRSFRQGKENLRTRWQRFSYELRAWFNRKTTR